MNKILMAIIFVGMIGLALTLTGCTKNPTDLAGSSGWVVAPPTLSVVPTNTMEIPTNISCTTVQDCIDFSLTQDPTSTNISAKCDKTCTYITEKRDITEVPQ